MGKLPVIKKYPSWVIYKDATTDLEGLKLAFDSNEDGVFNLLDEKWGDFYLWNDKNLDGISTADELEKLAVSDVVSINLEAEVGSGYREDDVNVLGTTTYQTKDGEKLQVGDTEFHYVEEKEKEEKVSTETLEVEGVKKVETLEEVMASLNQGERKEVNDLFPQSPEEKEDLAKLHEKIEELYLVEERKLTVIKESDKEIREMSEKILVEYEAGEREVNSEGVKRVELSESDLDL